MIHFHNYLKQSKELVTKVNFEGIKCVHVVMGNESCDLDSTIAPLALACFYANDKYRCSDIKVIPVMNVAADDFPIKTESNYLLDKYKVDKSNLIFKDEINMTWLCQQERLKITLVDHHILSESDSHLKCCVTEIIDHRPLDKASEWDKNVRFILSQVGSCCTLIANEIFQIYNRCLCTVAQLLYETIVFDTIGFKPEAGKSKELDFTMAEQLEKLLKPTKTRLEIFDELWAAHNNVSALTTRQLLSKDLKQIGNVLIPGLPMLVQHFISRPDFEHAISSFFSDKNGEAIIIMGLETEDGITRDIAFYPVGNDVVKKLQQRILADELQLEEVANSLEQLNVYKQNNVLHSRKYLIPIIKDTIAEK